MKNILTVHFFLKERIQKNNKSQINLRIIVDRHKVEVATQLYVSLDEWDKSAQKTYKNKAVNEELTAIANEIFQLKNKLRYENLTLSAKILKDLYLGKTSTDSLVLEYFKTEIARRKKFVKEFSIK